MVNSRYTGASGATWRTSSRTSRVRLAARVDFTTYAGEPIAHVRGCGPVSGKYTTASPASRQSFCFTSFTTPTTVNDCSLRGRRMRCPRALWSGQSFCRRGPADDDAVVRRHRLALGKRSPEDLPDPHRAEVVAAGEVLVDQHAAAVVRHGIGEEPAPARAFVERNVVDDTHVGHAWQRAQALHEIQVQLAPRGTVHEMRLVRCELERVDVLRSRNPDQRCAGA